MTGDPDECNGVEVELKGSEESEDTGNEWMGTVDISDN